MKGRGGRGEQGVYRSLRRCRRYNEKSLVQDLGSSGSLDVLRGVRQN